MAALHGVYSASVLDNQDPNNTSACARARLRPGRWTQRRLGDQWRLRWPGRIEARFIPDVDDEVLVAFARGDIRAPYVIGTMWNAKPAPTLQTANRRRA